MNATGLLCYHKPRKNKLGDLFSTTALYYEKKPKLNTFVLNISWYFIVCENMLVKYTIKVVDQLFTPFISWLLFFFFLNMCYHYLEREIFLENQVNNFKKELDICTGRLNAIIFFFLYNNVQFNACHIFLFGFSMSVVTNCIFCLHKKKQSELQPAKNMQNAVNAPMGPNEIDRYIIFLNDIIIKNNKYTVPMDALRVFNIK